MDDFEDAEISKVYLVNDQDRTCSSWFNFISSVLMKGLVNCAAAVLRPRVRIPLRAHGSHLPPPDVTASVSRVCGVGALSQLITVFLLTQP